MNYTGLSPYIHRHIGGLRKLVCGITAAGSLLFVAQADAGVMANITATATVLETSAPNPALTQDRQPLAFLIDTDGNAIAVELNNVERQLLHSAEQLPELVAEVVVTLANPDATESTKKHQTARILEIVLTAEHTAESGDVDNDANTQSERLVALPNSQGRRYQRLSPSNGGTGLGFSDPAIRQFKLPLAEALKLPINTVLLDLDPNFSDNKGGAHALLYNENGLKLGIGLQVELSDLESVPNYYYSGMLKYRFKK